MKTRESVCIMCSACYSTHVRFTAPTPTYAEHSADAEASAQSRRVIPRFWRKEAQWTQSKRPYIWQGEMALLAVSFFLKSLQGKGVEMGHHSGGNIHALRLTTGSVCVCVCPQLVRQVVCVLHSCRLPWLSPFPLYAWKRPISKMNMWKLKTLATFLLSLLIF